MEARTTAMTGEPDAPLLPLSANEKRAEELGIPFVELTSATVDEQIVDIIPESVARRMRVLPLFRIENSLSVAMADPTDVLALDELRRVTGCSILPSLCSERDLVDALDRWFRVDADVRKMVETISRDEDEEDDESVTRAHRIDMKDAAYPIVNLVNVILLQATRDGASDIHVEPDVPELRVRYRVDGVLREAGRFSMDVHPSFISRVKTMSNMDISERRRPQDGRMLVHTGQKEVDLRVSTLPTVMGEKVVLRILDRSALNLKLDELGFPANVGGGWRDMVRNPDGVVLVTGPTGSGKTSTLYATLEELNSIDRNIVTVEDPVEFNFPVINQVQVNEKAGLSFASVLRSILRQDPDVIMIGEVRDQDTAEIAVRAALTGHLVLSTLHTNDSISAVTRLVDMGIPPYLVASSVRGILAQRLVRRICARCKTEAEPAWDLCDLIGLSADELGEMKIWRGEGCRECGGTGYRGRTGLYELFRIEGELARAIVRGAEEAQLYEIARRTGSLTLLREDGIKKVRAGITTLNEFVRVTRVTKEDPAPRGGARE
ncbi:MAG: GspE/PulE family protein [Candidatus Eisenbacteria bacterium]